ncbi:MAG: hypothetical protein VX435_02670 [Planctomycetota bacterium]|jgi:hypothetical protein|nr:hypothetical protein [Planctomycetota bacterium]
MNSTGPIAVLVEDFQLGSAAQQLTDRLLIGYPRQGEFHVAKGVPIRLFSENKEPNDLIDKRIRDFQLIDAKHIKDALVDAPSVLVVPRGAGHHPSEKLIESVLDGAIPGARIFVHGLLSRSVRDARNLVEKARLRKLTIIASSYMPGTWRLPEVEVERERSITDAAIIVVGPSEEAEFLGIDGLLPLVDRRLGGESGVRQIQCFEEDQIWDLLDRQPDIAELMATAISRTDTPQGDPVRDGRTQDLVKLGLVQQLAKSPQLYLLEHSDGLRSWIFVLNGVIADFNFAIRYADRSLISAQFFRTPQPNAHHWSALVDVLEKFFETGRLPWAVERGILAAGIVEGLAETRSQVKRVYKTPRLSGITYSARESSLIRR